MEGLRISPSRCKTERSGRSRGSSGMTWSKIESSSSLTNSRVKFSKKSSGRVCNKAWKRPAKIESISTKCSSTKSKNRRFYLSNSGPFRPCSSIYRSRYLGRTRRRSASSSDACSCSPSRPSSSSASSTTKRKKNNSSLKMK